jgi:predicted enzyme related to lactoylglutathione lyase
MAQFRYIVTDVDAAIEFYTTLLGFSLKQQFGPAMAIVELGDLSLWLAGPLASASKPMPDGSVPKPGGWSRFVLSVEDLASLIGQLKDGKVTFRSDLIEGPGGKQILCEDPSGNVVELFEAVGG